MIYVRAADTVFVIHALFIAWVGLGSVAVLCWPRLALLHLPWGAYVSFTEWPRPQTPLEQSLRIAAGQRGCNGGCIDHHLLAFINPDGLTRYPQIVIVIVIGLGLLLVHLFVYVRLVHRWRVARR